MPILTTQSAKGYGFGSFAGAIDNSFESIATALTTSSTSEIVFSSIPSTYAHLHIRMSTLQDSQVNVHVQINGDTGSNYYWHELFGDGSSPASGYSSGAVNHIKTGYTHNTGTYYSGSSVVNILDYTSSNKKVVNAFTGSNADATGSGYVLNRSGHWTSTSAITSLRFFTNGGNFKANTRIALYGIKG